MKINNDGDDTPMLVWDCVNKAELDNYIRGLVNSLEYNKRKCKDLTDREKGLLQSQIDTMYRIIEGLENGEWDLKYTDARSILDVVDAI